MSNILEPVPDWMFGDSVEARNALQRSGSVHPFTCGNDECRARTNQAPLLAVPDGWLCEHCGYRQSLEKASPQADPQDGKRLFDLELLQDDQRADMFRAYQEHLFRQILLTLEASRRVTQ